MIRLVDHSDRFQKLERQAKISLKRSGMNFYLLRTVLQGVCFDGTKNRAVSVLLPLKRVGSTSQSVWEVALSLPGLTSGCRPLHQQCAGNTSHGSSAGIRTHLGGGKVTKEDRQEPHPYAARKRWNEIGPHAYPARKRWNEIGPHAYPARKRRNEIGPHAYPARKRWNDIGPHAYPARKRWNEIGPQDSCMRLINRVFAA